MASLHLAQEIFKLIYPVGSIYLSTSTTNPSTYFGGTWEQVAKGTYLLGYDGGNTWFDKPGQNKGSKSGPGNWNTNNHTLTIDQIPSHNHKLKMRNAGKWNWNDGSASGDMMEGGYYWTQGNTTYNWLIENQPQGRGKGHNHFHISPYYIVVVWKRTA